MAHRLIDKQEVKRLAQRADNRYTLLLSHTQTSGRLSGLVGKLQTVEHPHHLAFGAIRSQAVFHHYVIHHGQFAKQSHLLRKISKGFTTQSAPTLYRKAPHILSVKKYLTVIVSTRTVDKRAQRRLAGTALGLDYIGRRTHKTHILTQPHFAVTHGRLRFAPPEYTGEHFAQSYSIYHFIAVKRNTSTGH